MTAEAGQLIFSRRASEKKRRRKGERDKKEGNSVVPT